MGTNPVSSQQVANIRASSGNVVSTALTINPVPCVQALTLTANITDLLTGNGTLNGTVTLTGPAPQGGQAVTFVNGGVNVGTVNVAQGQTSATVNLTVSNLRSLIGSVITALTSPPCGGVNAIVAANAPLVSGVGLSPATVNGGVTSTGTVTLNGAAPAGGTTVALTSSSPVVIVPGSVTVQPGQTSATFTANTTNPALATTATITALGPANLATGTLTVNPAGPQPVTLAGVSFNPASVTGGSSSTGTVTLAAPAPAGGASVSLSSNNPAATAPAGITVPAGQTAATFNVTTVPVGSATPVTITATSANSVNGGLTVNPPCVGGLNLSVNAVPGGSPVTGTVTLTGPAPAGGQTVQLAYVGTGVSGPSSVLVPGGQTTATFNIATSPVATIVNSAIQALTGPCPGVTANLQVNPPVPVLAGVSITPSTIALGGNALGAVTLSGASASDTVVNLSTNIPGTQIGIPAQVTIPAGSTVATFPVFNLIPALSGLLTPVVGTVNAAAGGTSVNTGVTLQVL